MSKFTLIDAAMNFADSDNKKPTSPNKKPEKKYDPDNQEIIRLKGVNQNLRNQLKDLNENLRQILEERDKNEEEFEKYKQKVKTPSQQVQSLQAELKNAQKKIDYQEKEIKQLQQYKNSADTSRVERLENRLTERTRLLKENQDEIKSLKNQINWQEKKIEKLNEEREEPEEIQRSLLSQIEGYREMITELKQQINKQEENAKKQHIQNQAYEDKYRKLCKQVGIVPKSNSEYDKKQKQQELSKINSFMKNFDEQTKEYKDLEDRHKDQSKKWYTQEKSLKNREVSYQKEIKELKEEIKNLKQTADDAEFRLKRKEKLIFQTEKHNKDLKKQVTHLQRQRTMSVSAAIENNNHFLQSVQYPNQTTEPPVNKKLLERQKWQQKEQQKKDFKGNLQKSSSHFSDVDAFMGQKGRIIAVTVWNNGKEINGIQFTYQLQYQFGEIKGKQHYEQNGGEAMEDRFQVEKDDFVKSCKCCLNEEGFISGLNFKTKRNKEYRFGRITKQQVSYNIDFLETPGAAFGGLHTEDGNQSLLCYLGFEIRKDFHIQLDQITSSPMQRRSVGNSPFKRRDIRQLTRVDVPSFNLNLR